MSADERDNVSMERSDVVVCDDINNDQIASEDVVVVVNDVSDDDSSISDDTAEVKKEFTVTNLKSTFEHLSKVQSDTTDKPNWWIRQNSHGEYIIYSSNTKPPGKKVYRKISNPEKFLAQMNSKQLHEIIDEQDDKITELCRNTASNRSSNNNNNEINNQTDDKITISVESEDLHKLCSTDSSSDDDEFLNEASKDTVEPYTDDVTETTTEEVLKQIETAQEAEEVDEFDKNLINKSEVLSTSNRSSNQSNTHVEALNEKNKRQLTNVIQELIQTEKNYVASLERGIETYFNTLDSRAQNFPALIGKKYHIFGNIERIYAFHKEVFLPSLIACDADVIRVANLFYTSITKDHFYGYVLFGLNKPRAEKLTVEYKEFFVSITKESEDRLGVNSFLLQPIQILPRYKLLFGEMIKALGNDLMHMEKEGVKNAKDMVKDIVSACCIAEKQLQRLLDNVNEALSLNDIEEVHEFDLLEQGKFKKMNEFEMYDSDVGRRFRGKAFLFEQTLVCTEFMEKSTKLLYRTHIVLDDVMFIDTDNKDGFKIITTNNKETEFNADLLKTQEWIKLLTAVDERGVVLRSDIKVRNCATLSRTNSMFTSISSVESHRSTFGRSKLSSNTVRVTKREKEKKLDALFTEKPPRVESLISNSSSKSNRSSSSSQESYDLGGTIWYVSLEELSSTPPPAVKTS